MATPTLTSLSDGRPRSALGEVWAIAWPTVLAMTSYTVMQFFDKLMVGQVGPLELAAQNVGGLASFGIVAFAMGMVTIVNTFVSQNLGAGTPQNGPRYAWASLWLSGIVWIAVLLPYALVLPSLFDLLRAEGPIEHLLLRFAPSFKGHEPRLIELEADYARILVFGSIALLWARSINQFFFGMHRPRVVTVAAIVGNVVNVIGNYILIYGHEGVPGWNLFGFFPDGLPGCPGVPPLGVRGAAIATVFGSVVELIIPMAVFLGPRLHRELNTRHSWRFDWPHIRDLIRVGWPQAVQWGNELICWAIFMTCLVGFFGKAHIAASGIAFTYMGLSFMPAVGFSVAASSLVGRYIGEGRPEEGARRAHAALKLAMVYMTICGLVFFFFREPMVEWFLRASDSSLRAENAEIIRIGAGIMICVALFQTFDAVGVIYSGALRGAGDTVVPGIITVVYSWTFILGLGAVIVALRPDWSSWGPWIAASVYIILFGVTLGYRFESGRWKNIRLLSRSAPAAPPAPLTPSTVEN